MPFYRGSLRSVRPFAATFSARSLPTAGGNNGGNQGGSSGPSGPVKLAQPSLTVTHTDETSALHDGAIHVAWSAVTGAVGYHYVSPSNQQVDLAPHTNNTLDLTGLAAGSYTFTLRSTGDGTNYSDSDVLSTTVVIMPYVAPPNARSFGLSELSDNFNDADGAVGNGWGGGGWSIAGHQLVPSSSIDNDSIIHAFDHANVDISVDITVTQSQTDAGILALAGGTNLDYVCVDFSQVTQNAVRIIELSNGAGSITAYAYFSWVVGQTYRLRMTVNGTQVTGYVNGQQVVQATMAHTHSGTNVGFRHGAISGNPQFDNFTADAYGAVPAAAAPADNFNRANGPLGHTPQGHAYFTPVAHAGGSPFTALAVSGNEAVGTAHESSGMVHWAYGSSFDVTAQFVMGGAEDGQPTDYVDLIVLSDGTIDNSYFIEVTSTGVNFYRRINGTLATLSSGLSASIATGSSHSLRIALAGGTISAYLDATLVASESVVSQLASNDGFGVHHYSISGGFTYLGSTGSRIYADTFNRGDADPVSIAPAGFAYIPNSQLNTAKLYGGHVVAESLHDWGIEVDPLGDPTADYDWTVTHNVTDTGNSINLFVNIDPTNGDLTHSYYVEANASTCAAYKWNGSTSQLGVTTAGYGSTGSHTLRIARVSGVMSFYIDGRLVATSSDTQWAGYTRIAAHQSEQSGGSITYLGATNSSMTSTMGSTV